ncbi:hypothetical protein EJ110_NYTH05097 [Nymphaea thermarum]|nr:hypothetical protein EJ110_NYTH05097 [Nymphaea thermarum]
MAFKVLISSLFISMVLIQCASACPSCGEPYKPPTPKPPVYKPPVHPHYPANPHCPVDGFKLDACFNLLHGLLNVVLGRPPSGSECCPVIAGLVDFEAAACLCNVVKADILGVHLEFEKKFSLLVNTCGCSIPKGYKCA